MKSLIEIALPEFGATGPDTVRTKRSKRNLNYIRRRSDGLFERIFIEQGRAEVPPLVTVQFAVNFFVECPIPSGPFGYDAGLFDVITSELRSALQRYYWGAAWYMVPADPDQNATLMRLLRTALQGIVRPALDDWAQKLNQDAIVTTIFDAYGKLSPEESETAEETLRKSVAALGNFCSRGYPVEKMARQLTLRLQKNKSWHLF